MFELDRRSGELRKDGVRVRLQEQPLRVLDALLAEPGEPVTREALRQRLWPDDTFVDFDNGLNRAINRLRAALGDEADNPRFIETLERRGYRFIAPVARAGGPRRPPGRPSAPETRLDRAGAGPPPGDVARWRIAAAAALAVLLIAFAPALRRGADPGDRAPIRSLAVLPLANLTGDPAQDYFSDGMTDALITNLASLPALRVISRQSVMRYKGSAKPLPEIARELGVEGVVEGSVVRVGAGGCASPPSSSTPPPTAISGPTATNARWRTCSRFRASCRARSPRRSASRSARRRAGGSRPSVR